MTSANAKPTRIQTKPRSAGAHLSNSVTLARRWWLRLAATGSLMGWGATSGTAWSQDASGRSTRPESALSRDLASRSWRSDALKIDFPPLADSGHSVPFEVVVQAPPGRTLTTLEIILPENPFPMAVKLRLPTPASRYRFSTRLRLAASQRAWAIATFDDGTQQGAGAATVITSSACLDES